MAWRKRLLIALFGIQVPGSAWALELQVPLACTFGQDCWIQQYPDHGGGAGARDYTCNGETYVGHDGTDFRVLNTRKTATVVAAAAGVVVATRDGTDDILANTPDLLRAVARKECGNGVVIDHGDGYQTQYCHMHKDSIAVRPGDKVQPGTALGKVGFSGAAAFAHLHFSLRHGQVKLDPFAGELLGACGKDRHGYWSAQAAQTLNYHALDLLELGWAAAVPAPDALELGQMESQTPSRDWPALVAYARLINLKMGDIVAMDMHGANDFAVQQSQTVDHDKADFVFSLGKKRGQAPWAAGQYTTRFVVTRSGVTILDQTRSIAID